MSKVRVLVGTRKGAFILTSDGKRENWQVDGPHFTGWEIYHVKGSPADPNRIYASQTSGWCRSPMKWITNISACAFSSRRASGDLSTAS